MTVFILNGALFASLVSRIPNLRENLSLSNRDLGFLLLFAAAGSLLALPSAGRLIQRFSAGAVVGAGAILCALGLSLAGFGASIGSSLPLAAGGLFCYGVGTGVWDVAMNVEGAEVERGLGRSVMPRFHAGWSVGSIGGAGVGVVMTWLGVPMTGHLAALGALVGVLVLRSIGDFLPATEQRAVTRAAGSAWLEPRTLAIGVMVLCFAVAEGSANDWLSLALIDGYDTAHWLGVAGFALFVTAMTVGRVAGPVVLDRFGRTRVLLISAVLAASGVLLLVFGGSPLVAGLGILTWGVGASLGFPVGMSAAADDPARAAARVSVVSTIGYGAFLAGPPLLGALGDRVGTLDALLVVALLMGPAALSVVAARPTYTV